MALQNGRPGFPVGPRLGVLIQFPRPSPPQRPHNRGLASRAGLSLFQLHTSSTRPVEAARRGRPTRQNTRSTRCPGTLQLQDRVRWASSKRQRPPLRPVSQSRSLSRHIPRSLFPRPKSHRRRHSPTWSSSRPAAPADCTTPSYPETKALPQTSPAPRRPLLDEACLYLLFCENQRHLTQSPQRPG